MRWTDKQRRWKAIVNAIRISQERVWSVTIVQKKLKSVIYEQTAITEENRKQRKYAALSG